MSYNQGSPLCNTAFKGRYNQIMPELRAADLTPWSPADVMDERIGAVGAEYQVLLWENIFDTDFGLAATSKEIILLPRSELLHKITPETKRVYGGIPLKTIPKAAQRHKRTSALEKLLNTPLKESLVRTHPLWLALADGSQERLAQYAKNAFRLGKDQYRLNEMMGLYIPCDSEPIVRAVALRWLLGGLDADGGLRTRLHYLARLVGIGIKSNERGLIRKKRDRAAVRYHPIR